MPGGRLPSPPPENRQKIIAETADKPFCFQIPAHTTGSSPPPHPPFPPSFPPPDIYMLNPPSYIPLSPPKNIRKTPPPSLVKCLSVTEVPLVMPRHVRNSLFSGTTTETMSIMNRTSPEKQGKQGEVQQNPPSIGKRTQSDLPKPLGHTEEMIPPPRFDRCYTRIDWP